MKSLRPRSRPASASADLRGKEEKKTRSSAPISAALTSKTTPKKKNPKFYNTKCTEKPTELFRTDFITQMTVSDLEPLNTQHHLISITDPWRRDWNNGVQVPVYSQDDTDGPKILKRSSDSSMEFSKNAKDSPTPTYPPAVDFQEVSSDSSDEDSEIPEPRSLRKKKKSDDIESKFQLPTSVIGRNRIRYDLDELDASWIRLINAKLAGTIHPRFVLSGNQMEKAMERLEIGYALCCADQKKSDAIIHQESDLDAVCDVCRGEFSEDDNPLVFCDRCGICVHQACYGIRRIPSGPWICRPCALNLRPSCVLCPNLGGALKPTDSGERWAHVSCAVWIPEIKFGNAQFKEPIAKISKIPEARWKLVCEICEKRKGACVQCSVRSCHVSYHVTCAQRAGWKVTYKDLLSDDDTGDVLENYCKKHSKNWPPPKEKDDEPGCCSSDASIEPASLQYKLLFTLTFTDFGEHAFERLQEIPAALRRAVFNYWRTKRLAQPEWNLIFNIDQCHTTTGRDREAEFMCRRVDNLVSLRQTLERTRTLCYMIERRERLKRQWIDTAHNQFRILSNVNGSSAKKDNALNVGQFLKSFPLGYEPTDWLPQQKKMTELFSMIPPIPTISKVVKPPPIAQSSPSKKRGRPPKKMIKEEDIGNQSPLSTVNATSTPKNSNDTNGMVTRTSRKRQLSNMSDEKNGDIAHQPDLKRRRLPRVQYSPTYK